jgi:hypothetical protein
MKYIALHHSITPLNMGEAQSLKIIEDTHIKNFGLNPSKLNGSSIGYNFTIDRYGIIKQWRNIGEETMAQKGYNFDTVSICMLIDGDKQMPTLQMLQSVKKLVYDTRKTYGNIPLKPHRWFTGGGSLCQFANDKPKQTDCPHKTCCGSLMTDAWIDQNFNLGLNEVKPTSPTITKIVYTKCELGDISENVDRIQDLLVSLGFLANKNTFKEYDEAMAEAVNKYQTKNSIGTWAERKINQGAYIGPKTLLVLNC